tara:strand:- start:352 stop:1335 length:984 start_codon:yes stop_codon:yes gene_type:complete
MILLTEIETAFQNAILNASITKDIVWQQIQYSSMIAFGFEPTERNLFFVIGGSVSEYSEWTPITSIFEKRIGNIQTLPEVFEKSLCLRFAEENLFHSFFLEFIEDLVRDVPDSGIEQHYKDIFAIWENKFSIFEGNVASEELRGLMAELIVLASLIEFSEMDVVHSWVGPKGDLHDFENDFWHIEVKESMRPDPVAHIHPISQLEPIGIPFNLIVISLSRDDTGDNIQSLIYEIRENIASRPDVSEHFEVVLAQSVYPRLSHTQKLELYSIKNIGRLEINEHTNVLYPAQILTGVQYDDISWKLRYSDHPFVELDEGFWINPGRASI